MRKNWDRKAMRFASARYVPRQGMLDVTFENGDHFVVAAESVLTLPSNGRVRRPGSRTASHAVLAASPDWTRLRIGETGDVLEAPADGMVVEIPWDRIRSIADPEFRAHLADHASERARRIGARIRELRLEAGMTRVALAERVGVPREEMAELEAGKLEPQLDLIDHVATVLGRPARDFCEE